MRGYLVKEMFGPTLQGEGAHAGRACVFLRFAACNLACTWCDTDFTPDTATRHAAGAIVERLLALDVHGSRTVIVTGGEPTLQYDAPLADALHAAGFRVHMESNGTRVPDGAVDWLTISPKAQFHTGSLTLAPALAPSELKVVVDDTVDAGTLDAHAARWRAAHHFVQPCMDERYEHHLARTMALVHSRPLWRMSLQLHKVLRIP